ncbi:MAG TPA: nucleotide pyrophosphohydrolase [Steroidobacteraceae bacterium]|jgi:NTP pyrophosphatase (non-canonical NTP hydrolase)|nr:nucleotide pyrophosphohydrolase [Steroidobacteraceae bacterium]
MGDPSSFEKLREEVRKFASERNWEQFHSPKNLSMALCVEAAELLELFQWKTESDSQSLSNSDLERAREELADVLLYLISLADRLGIDLAVAAKDKLRINAGKYPITKSFGSSRKYTDL